MSDYTCPKCGRGLAKQGFAASGNPRWICRGEDRRHGYCYSTTSPEDSKQRDRAGRNKRKAPVFRRSLTDSKRYIITAAQNATPVHAKFLASLLTAAKHLSAELLVIPFRYKNPTSRWTESQRNVEEWAKEVQPFLWNVRKALNENLMVLGDIKTQPTMSQPLDGLDALSHGSSGIIGHAKLQFKTVPTPQSRMAKILTTTGACTVPNYTDSRTGKVGEFHHTLGAVLVEISGRKFHLRQLNAARDTGEFTDLTTIYTPTGVRAAPRPLALIMGDTHVDFIDPDVEAATFGPEGLVAALQPAVLVWHDLLDGYSVNPHHNGNPFNKIAKWKADRASVRAEVERAIQFVARRTPANASSVIVSSNHDDFLRRWVVNHDWKTDEENAEFYLETALAMVRGTKMGSGGTEYPSPFPYWVARMQPARVRCLNGAESFSLGGVELAMHGDRGPNGARGSIRNLRRIGIRSVVGHSHSPGINEGCYQTGTSTRLRLEYNGGPSSWLQTHCLLYADGKRTLINIIEGDWRLG